MCSLFVLARACPGVKNINRTSATGNCHRRRAASPVAIKRRKPRHLSLAVAGRLETRPGKRAKEDENQSTRLPKNRSSYVAESQHVSSKSQPHSTKDLRSYATQSPSTPLFTGECAREPSEHDAKTIVAGRKRDRSVTHLLCRSRRVCDIRTVHQCSRRLKGNISGCGPGGRPFCPA